MHLSSSRKYLPPQPKINTGKCWTAQNSIHILQLNVESFIKEGQWTAAPTPLPFIKHEISGLRRYCQHTTVDILVAVTRIVGCRSRRRVEITWRNISMICPGDIHRMVRTSPA